MLSTKMDRKNRLIICSITYISSLIVLLVEIGTVYPDDTSHEDEGRSRHGHHTIVHVASLIDALGDELEAQQRSAAEELAHATDDDEDERVAQSVADAVEERGPRLVGHGKGLQTTHEDTVGDDQTDIDGELHAHVVGEGLEHLVDHRHQRGNDHQLHDDTDAVGDGVADDGDDRIGKCRDDCYGKAHDDSRLQLRSDGQGGANTQHLNQDWVVKVEGIGQSLFVLFTE